MTRPEASPDLAQQVRAAIDEAERRARRTAMTSDGTPATWIYVRERFWAVAEHDGRPVGVASRRSGIGTDGKPYDDVLLDVDGEHMELNDPAAVARRCEADRRTVERHRPVGDHGRFSDDWADDCPNPGDCAHTERPPVCMTCRTYAGDPIPAPCPDLLDRAAAYGITTEVSGG